MSYAAICRAIDERLATVNFDPTRIAFLNVTYTPVSGSPYLVASMPVLKRPALTIGAEQLIGGAGLIYQWRGTYQVDAVWPEDSGADGAAQMVDMLLRLFPQGLTVATVDGLTIAFFESTPVPVRPDGAWFRGAVSCPWWSFQHA